ncbi:hypothetical protein [Streptomyces sp. NPDC001743]|uniref:hypothetical protein n=1 Tax=Streptomyces sp. NPDC001743 TaxID=3154397 RepID=UPI00332C38D0
MSFKRSRMARMASALGTILGALALVLTIPNSAFAAGCSGSGCDDHDPNIQTWQSGPVTNYTVQVGGSEFLELRWGKTDGDQYSWARLEYFSLAPDYHIMIERCNSSGTSCTTYLGYTKVGASGWTAKVAGSSNTYVTRTPMYYNPSTSKARACIVKSNGATTCTPYY